jgi:hypothetical protein
MKKETFQISRLPAMTQLWLLHSWVWAYNPQGIFNPTNPMVHLH